MSAKKDFTKRNPALDYITEPLEGQITADEIITVKPAEPAAPAAEQPARIYDGIQPIKRENRSTKLNLLVTPTVHAKIKEIAALKGQSMNGLIHSLLEHYIHEFEKEINADER